MLEIILNSIINDLHDVLWIPKMSLIWNTTWKIQSGSNVKNEILSNSSYNAER